MIARLKFPRVVCALATTLCLAACASSAPKPTPYWTIRETAFTGMQPGKSTKEDASRDIGVPILINHFPRKNEDAWDYRYLDGNVTVMRAFLYFDAQSGVLKRAEYFMDDSYLGNTQM
jgi:hypothetical protein